MRAWTIAGALLAAIGIFLWLLSARSPNSPATATTALTPSPTGGDRLLNPAGGGVGQLQHPGPTTVMPGESVEPSDEVLTDATQDSVQAEPQIASLDAATRETLERLRRDLRPDRLTSQICATWDAELARLMDTLDAQTGPWLRVVKARTDCLMTHQRPVDAQALLQELLRRYPDSVPLRNELANLFLSDGDPEGAWIVLQEAVALGADARTHSLIASVQEGRAVDSRIQSDPAENLARLHVAEASLRELIATEAPFPALINRKRLSQNLSLQQRHDEAIAMATAARAEFQRLAAEESLRAPGMAPDLIYAVAQAHYLAGDEAVARAWFDQVLQQPMSDDRRQYLTRQWERRHHLRQAMRELHDG